MAFACSRYHGQHYTNDVDDDDNDDNDDDDDDNDDDNDGDNDGANDGDKDGGDDDDGDGDVGNHDNYWLGVFCKRVKMYYLFHGQDQTKIWSFLVFYHE